jgi:phosphohistidine swiveling domain-containing protein
MKAAAVVQVEAQADGAAAAAVVIGRMKGVPVVGLMGSW